MYERRFKLDEIIFTPLLSLAISRDFVFQKTSFPNSMEK